MDISNPRTAGTPGGYYTVYRYGAMQTKEMNERLRKK